MYKEIIEETEVVEIQPEYNEFGLPVHKTFYAGAEWGFPNKLYEMWIEWFKTSDGNWDLKTTKLKYGKTLRIYDA